MVPNKKNASSSKVANLVNFVKVFFLQFFGVIFGSFILNGSTCWQETQIEDALAQYGSAPVYSPVIDFLPISKQKYGSAPRRRNQAGPEAAAQRASPTAPGWWRWWWSLWWWRWWTLVLAPSVPRPPLLELVEWLAGEV